MQNAHLPCKVAHQTEVPQTFTQYPKVYNFTTATGLQQTCELFLLVFMIFMKYLCRSTSLSRWI